MTKNEKQLVEILKALSKKLASHSNNRQKAEVASVKEIANTLDLLKKVPLPDIEPGLKEPGLAFMKMCSFGGHPPGRKRS